MIRKMKGFFAVCDVCGEEFNVDGVNQVYDTKKVVSLILGYNGWKRLGRKKWACAECSKKLTPLAQNNHKM